MIPIQSGRWPYPVVGLLGVVEGLYHYYMHGAVSEQAWQRLLRAHALSNGRFTEWLKPLIALLRPRRKVRDRVGLLGAFSREQQQSIVSALRNDGFYRFTELMPQSLCDELQRYAEVTPALASGDPRKGERKIYDPLNPVNPIYKIVEPDAIHCPAMQKLMADEVFISIAESYIGAEPVIGGIDLWWSARHGNAPTSDAAQLFHFDFDAPPVWLKLFVYLTDIGPDDGPHVFVKGSHKPGLPQAQLLRARGYQRIGDAEMEELFDKDDFLTVTGPRGTVFLADTRGFHKGTLPTAHHRLLAQLIYCAPMFNDHILPATMPEAPIKELQRALHERPRIYERFTRG